MSRKDAELVHEIREAVRTWQDYFGDNIDQYHESFQFIFGAQWEKDQSDLLMQYQKTPMQFNKLAPILNHLIGEQRLNTPNLQLQPYGDVDEKILSIRRSILMQILFESESCLAYQNAFQQAGVGGFGAYRIGTQYEDNGSFNQIPVILSVKDPTRCFWDVASEHPNKIDSRISGIYTRMSRELFRQRYGKRIERSIAFTDGEDQTRFIWANDKSITMTESYHLSIKRKKLLRLSNNMEITEDKIRDFEKGEMFNPATDKKEPILMVEGMPVFIEKERYIEEFTNNYYKTAGDYVLDETIFPGSYSPMVFVDQNSFYDKNGQQICRPIAKDAIDSQRFINYLGTNITYLIKISRADQFLISKANAKSPDTQRTWKNPMVVQGGLFYDVDLEGGTKPEQLRPPEISQTLLQQYQRALEDIKSCTGVYSTQLGDYGYEVSGKAVDARTRQGSYSNYVALTGINRAIATGGMIMDEIIPLLYDSERLLMLEMPDVGLTPVTVNQQADEYGNMKNDIRKGKYKVKLIAGASHEGQKQEALNSLQLILQADPTAFNLIADLYAENLPLPNNIEIRNRFRTLVPPEIIAAGKSGQPLPPKQNQPDPKMLLVMATMKNKEQEIALKQQELVMKNKKLDQSTFMEWQKLENDRLEIAASLREQEMRYMAETNKTQSDETIAHANNLAKLLTKERG